MNGYGAFARFYDSLTTDAEYAKRAEYVRALLSAAGAPAGTLLDLACGTGSLAVELAAAGYDVIGVDASGDMLSLAGQKFERRGLKALLLCQRMQELDLYGTVDAAVCSLDSLNHLTEPEDVKKTFERVSLFLNPGGVFVFDVNTHYKHKAVLADNTFVFETDSLYCVWRNRLDRKTSVVDVTLDFFEEKGGQYYRSAERFSERAYALSELKNWLSEAGLQPLHVYRELTYGPPAGKTQRAVFVARKAE